MGILIIVLIVATIVVSLSGFKIVKQAEVMIVERLGRYERTLDSGLHFIIPIIETPRGIIVKQSTRGVDGQTYSYFVESPRIDLREKVYDFPRQNVITKDNVSISINALIYFQIVDPKSAVYEIQNLPEAIEKLTQTTLRNIIGELDLDQTLVSRDTINAKLRIILDEASQKWGVKVNRVELQDIIPPTDIQTAMEKQMKAERDRRAAILEAEGLKKAAILQADAEAQAIRKVIEAIGQTGPADKYLIATRYIDTLKQMVEGKNNKVVYMPYEASGLLSSVDGIKQLLDSK